MLIYQHVNETFVVKLALSENSQTKLLSSGSPPILAKMNERQDDSVRRRQITFLRGKLFLVLEVFNEF